MSFSLVEQEHVLSEISGAIARFPDMGKTATGKRWDIAQEAEQIHAKNEGRISCDAASR
jgi:hypothetical protein